MAAVETHAPAKRRARIAASYREPLRAAAWHLASWFFVGVCLLCAGYLVVAGYFGSLLIALGTLVGTAFFLLITIPLTSPVAAPPWPTPASTDAKTRRWLWAQVAVLVVLALLIYHWTLNGNVLLPAGLSVIPLWTPFLGWTFHGVYSLLGSHMPAAFPLNNVAPIILLLLPGALLLLLGARPGELGFARGYRSWRVAAVWSSVPAHSSRSTCCPALSRPRRSAGGSGAGHPAARRRRGWLRRRLPQHAQSTGKLGHPHHLQRRLRITIAGQ